MLRRLQIDGFKSFVDFSLELEPLTLLIGENGVGKSTVLQAIDLAAHLVSMPLSNYLEMKGWNYSDLVHLKSSTKRMRFDLEMEITPLGATKSARVHWSLELGRRKFPGIASEVITADGKPLLKREGPRMWRFEADGSEEPRIKQSIGTSYLGSVDPDDDEDIQRFPVLVALKRWITRISPYVNISPRNIGAARAGTSLGYQGELLAGFIAHLESKNPDAFTRVQQRLGASYNRFKSMRTKRRGPGWHDLLVTEAFGDDSIELLPRQLSDGLLRLIAIAAMPEQKPSLFMLDELENGIHPELAGALVGLLKEVTRSGIQALATTHSPMLVNDVEDVRGVTLMYRSDDGTPKAIRLADSKAYEKLGNYMGLGEVWVNSRKSGLTRHS